MTNASRKVRNVLVLDAGGPGSMAAMSLIKCAELPVKIIAGDLDKYSTAQVLADIFIKMPAGNSTGYVEAIREVIDKYQIDIVLPSFHFGFEQLAEAELPDVFLVDFNTGLLCRDKWAFYEWCMKHGYPSPRTTLASNTGEISAKSYIKPRFGAGSKDNYTVRNTRQLQAASTITNAAREDYLVQAFIDGEHWSVEAIRRGSKLVACSTMRIVRHKAGNAITAQVKDDKKLTMLIRNLLNDLAYQGPANIDLIKDSTGKFYILEVNPRFGSTIQFTGVAGSNLVAFLLTGRQEFINEPREGYYTSWTETGLLPVN